MFDLPDIFSSIISPTETISSLIEHFKKTGKDFSVEFLYKHPEKKSFSFFKENNSIDNLQMNIEEIKSVAESKNSNEMVLIKSDELKRFDKNPDIFSYVLPVSFHKKLFGFLFVNTGSKKHNEIHADLPSYMKILSVLIANSFQNLYCSEKMEMEKKKKALITKELINSDRELDKSKKILFELQRSKVLGETLPVIFHKLKNKLTPILGYAQILTLKVKDDSINERIKKIEKNADELTNLLNLLKDYFKGYETQKQRESLNNIIHNLKPYFDAIENEKKIKINIDVDSNIPDELLNTTQIEILISNLIENAVCAIKEKGSSDGEIHIKTELKEDTYRLIIKDNGIGIKRDDISKIWVPFYSKFPGKIGIGLSVCERIILNHDATYNINSIEGEYSEFSINFKHYMSENDETINLRKPSKKRLMGKILIIDHQQYLSELLEEIISDEGDFEIIKKKSGKETIEYMKNNDFDLIILDIKKPDSKIIDIYDLIKQKKGEGKTLTLVSPPLTEDTSKFLRENKIEYLQKPIGIMNFTKKIFGKLN